MEVELDGGAKLSDNPESVRVPCHCHQMQIPRIKLMSQTIKLREIMAVGIFEVPLR